jgi:hypothetical protein
LTGDRRRVRSESVRRGHGSAAADRFVGFAFRNDARGGIRLFAFGNLLRCGLRVDLAMTARFGGLWAKTQSS